MISGGSKINYNLSDSDSENDGERRNHGAADNRFRSPSQQSP